MAFEQFIRVVALRKGRVKQSEFRLREDERGLSLFQYKDRRSANEVVEAVRAAGKQGDLAAVLLDASAIRELGLVVVRTPGGTLSKDANRLHVEARLSMVQRLMLFFRGIRGYDYFNDVLSGKLCALAKSID